VDDLRSRPDVPDLTPEAATLARLRTEAQGANQLEAAEQLRFYRKVRSLARDVALKNPLAASRPSPS